MSCGQCQTGATASFACSRCATKLCGVACAGQHECPEHIGGHYGVHSPHTYDDTLEAMQQDVALEGVGDMGPPGRHIDGKLRDLKEKAATKLRKMLKPHSAKKDKSGGDGEPKDYEAKYKAKKAKKAAKKAGIDAGPKDYEAKYKAKKAKKQAKKAKKIKEHMRSPYSTGAARRGPKYDMYNTF